MMDDTGLYVWAAYGMGIALALTEVGLLRLRDLAIRSFVGWRRGYPRAQGGVFEHDVADRRSEGE